MHVVLGYHFFHSLNFLMQHLKLNDRSNDFFSRLSASYKEEARRMIKVFLRAGESYWAGRILSVTLKDEEEFCQLKKALQEVEFLNATYFFMSENYRP